MKLQVELRDALSARDAATTRELEQEERLAALGFDGDGLDAKLTQVMLDKKELERLHEAEISDWDARLRVAANERDR